MTTEYQELFKEQFTTPDLVLIAEAAHYVLQNHFDEFADYLDLDDEVLMKLKSKLNSALNPLNP